MPVRFGINRMNDFTLQSTEPLRLAEVRVFSRVSKPLHYRIPDFLETPAIGSLVRVPLGKRSDLGIVIGISDQIDFPVSKLKNLLEIPYPHPIVSEDLFSMLAWMSKYYGSPQEVIMDRVFPSTLKKGLKSKEVSYIQISEAGKGVDLEKVKSRAPRQYQLMVLLRNQAQPILKGKTLSTLKISHSAFKSLLKKGWIQEIIETEERIGYDDELGKLDSIKPLDFELNDEQRNAVDFLIKKIDTGTFAPVLLHGVTGSGKTEVFVRAIRHVQQKDPDATVLFLVPEVALAPQTVSTLRSKLQESGVEVLVWHSHLSEGERRDSWLKIARGESKVVVGARSAIFTPLRNLKLIIVDEEHEPAYKQEENPRYHGRDLAVVRAKLNNACCILGSATPSLESLYNVKIKKYDEVRLRKRVDNRELPKVTLVDMRLEFRKNRKETILSQALKDALIDRLEKREQSILFLNRRGYSTHMSCQECGWIAMSEECSVPLTFHRSQNLLKCHLTGFEMVPPKRCPQCQSPKIRGEGFGTQKLEDLIKMIVPKARVYRIDADTMMKKNLFRHVLSDFRNGRLDILVGTQMIAKGLDFPNVTLVAVINADQSLYMEDFRAAERTFQLLVQVSGRAGRGERAGEVIIQTSTPHASPIQFARRNDFDGFLEEELELRREFNYPPFRHLIRHIIKGRSLEKVTFYTEKWKEAVDRAAFPETEIRGPIPASVEKIHGEYRFQLWYFTPRVISTVQLINHLNRQFKWDPQLSQHIDVDAINLM